MKLNYKVEGNGSAVILLHPVGLDLTCWDAILAPLTARHRVIRVDLRGHGQSGPEKAGMSLEDYAADVHETLNAVGVTAAAVFGLSFGGMVAQSLTIHHPGDASRLAVAGCPCTLPDPARRALSARGTAALEHGMASLIPETLDRWFTPEFLAQNGAEVKAIADSLLRTSPGAWNAAWQAISRIDTAPRLGEIAVPTLCIAGERDPAAPPPTLSEIAARIPGARLLVLADAPHIMQVEQPSQVADALLAFVSGAEIGEPVSG